MSTMITAASPESNTPRAVRSALDGSLDLASGDVLTVTKADSGSDFLVSRALYVGTGGDIQVLTEKGQTVLFKNVPDGALLPVRCTRVFATNSTVSDVLAMR